MESNITLWQFLLELLLSDRHSNIICWMNEDGEFKLLNAEQVAKLWGLRKNKHNMNYDKLSRALRYYYDKNIIKKVLGQKFVYRFVSFPEIIKMENKIPFRVKMETLHKSGMAPEGRLPGVPPSSEPTDAGAASQRPPRKTRESPNGDRKWPRPEESDVDVGRKWPRPHGSDVVSDRKWSRPLGSDVDGDRKWSRPDVRDDSDVTDRLPRPATPPSLPKRLRTGLGKSAFSQARVKPTPVYVHHAPEAPPTAAAFRSALRTSAPLHFWGYYGPAVPRYRTLAAGAPTTCDHRHFQFPMVAPPFAFQSFSPPPPPLLESVAPFLPTPTKPISVLH